MAHVRTQIRNTFKTVLEASLPVTYKVFASRKYARNIVDSEAIVDMQFLNDQTQARETMSDDRIHIGSLYIRVQRALTEDLIDDALDADELAVVTAIEGATWDDLLEEDPELTQVNFTDDTSGGKAIGGIVIRYDVEYRIDKSDPETVIE